MRVSVLAAITALGLAATPLGAQVCAPSPASTVPAFEAIKAVFIDGLSRAALEPFLANVAVADAVWDDLLVQVPEAYPDGFDRCASVVLRLDEPGLAQEVFLLRPVGQGSGLYVYLAGIVLDGSIQVMTLSYSTSVDQILERLR